MKNCLFLFLIIFVIGCAKEEETSPTAQPSSSIDTTNYFITVNDGVNPEVVCLDYSEGLLEIGDSTLMFSQMSFFNGIDSLAFMGIYFRFQDPIDPATVINVLTQKDPIFYEVIQSLLNGWTAVGMYYTIDTGPNFGDADEYNHVRRDTVNSFFNITQVKFDSTANLVFVGSPPKKANIFGIRGNYQCRTFLYDDTSKFKTFYGKYHLPMAYEIP